MMPNPGGNCKDTNSAKEGPSGTPPGGSFIFYLDMSGLLGYFNGKGNVAQTKDLPMKNTVKHIRKAFTLFELIFVLGFISAVSLVIFVIVHFLAKIW